MDTILHDFSYYFSRPANVQIDVTDECNLACVYCYNFANQVSRGEALNDIEFENVIEKIIEELNPVTVTFSGGEPFLRKDILFRSIKMLNEKDIEVQINTNALLIDQHISRELAGCEIKTVSVNIESLEPSEYDTIRGAQGSFFKLKNSLELLKKAVGNRKISIATVVNKMNHQSLLDIARYVKSNDFFEYHLLDMIPTNEESQKLILSKDEWRIFYKTYLEIVKLGIRIKPNHALLFLNEFSQDTVFPFCMAGRLKMVICANGDIVPCNYFKTPEYVCGNAVRDNLLEVWESSACMTKFRYSLKGYESCYSCEHFRRCAGGCKALSYFFYSRPFSPDPYCKTYKIKALGS